jgi:hypothetical protein
VRTNDSIAGRRRGLPGYTGTRRERDCSAASGVGRLNCNPTVTSATQEEHP